MLSRPNARIDELEADGAKAGVLDTAATMAVAIDSGCGLGPGGVESCSRALRAPGCPAVGHQKNSSKTSMPTQKTMMSTANGTMTIPAIMDHNGIHPNAHAAPSAPQIADETMNQT